MIEQGHERTFWGDGNIVYFSGDMDFSSIFIYQDLSNGTRKICLCKLYLQKESSKCGTLNMFRGQYTDICNSEMHHIYKKYHWMDNDKANNAKCSL